MGRFWAPLLWVGGVVAVVLVVFPLGYLCYDTTYGLVWGREIAHGNSPDYGAFLASTPHPLVDLVGIVTSPLGQFAAIDVTMVIAYAALGLVAYLVYRISSLWFDRVTGAVAAVIVMVSPVVLGTALRGALDIPYVAVCLGALLIETKRPRAGWPVLAILVLAGLLRPEAWLFSGAYWLYLVLDIRDGRLRWRGERTNGELVWLAGLAALGPVVWCLFDLITTGNALHSLTSTQESAKTLARQRGPVEWIKHGPHRIGQVIEWPATLAAIVGVVFGLSFLRRRSLLGVASAVLAIVAFAIVGFGGLAILPRYAILSATLLAVFAALGLLGWRLLDADHPWRRRWQWGALVLLLFFLVWAPKQWNLDSEMSDELAGQAPIERNLSDVIAAGQVSQLCGEFAVPGFQAIPRASLATGVEPSKLLEGQVPGRGYVLVPNDASVVGTFLPGDESRINRSTKAPSGFSLVARNAFWGLYGRC